MLQINPGESEIQELNYERNHYLCPVVRNIFPYIPTLLLFLISCETNGA